MTIKKGDNVIVLSGKDKGKKSKVLKTYPKTGKLLLEAVNMTKRHQRQRREGEKGQVVTIAMPVNASNVALFCSKCAKGSRSKYKTVSGTKILVCTRCDSEFK